MQTKIQKAKMLTLQSRINDLENYSQSSNATQARTIHTYLHLVRQIVQSNKSPKKKSELIGEIRSSRKQRLEGFGKKLSLQCRYQFVPQSSKKGNKQQFRIYNAKGIRKNIISLPNKFNSLQNEDSQQQPEKQVNFKPIGPLYQQNLSASVCQAEQQDKQFENNPSIINITKVENKNKKKFLIKPINSFFRNLVKSDFRNSNYKTFSKEMISNDSNCEFLSKSAIEIQNISQMDSPMPW